MLRLPAATPGGGRDRGGRFGPERRVCAWRDVHEGTRMLALLCFTFGFSAVVRPRLETRHDSGGLYRLYSVLVSR